MRVRGQCSRPNCDRRIDRRKLCRPHYVATGMAQGYVDAAPAKERLKLLRDRGLTIVMLEQQGITRSVIARIDREQQQIHSLTEQKILAIPIPINVVSSGADVPSLGTVRRLQALAAIGWPQTVLADKVDMTQSMLANRMGRLQVTAKTAATVAELFTQLQLTPGPSVIAQSRARAKGWPPPHAYDDIDDPSETPEPPSYSKASWLEKYTELKEIGVPESRIPERMGITRNGFEQQLRRLGLNVKGAA